GGGELDLVVVTSGIFDVNGEEDLRPEKATVLGPSRVIPWEYPRIACRVVDVVPPAPGCRQDAALAAPVARGRRVRLALLSRTALPPRMDWPEHIAAGDRLAGKLQRILDLEQ